jgi:PAS domain S-box-containing protein
MTAEHEILEDRPEFYRQAFHDSNDAIVLTDVEGHIVTVNQAWLTLYGYAIDEVRGQTTRIIKSAHTTPEVHAYMWSRIADPSQGFWKGELINRTRTGEEIAVLLTITPIRSEGRLIGYMGLGIDMTERRRIEEMQELYHLVVRHDLKAPLGSLSALLDTLADGYAGALSPLQSDIVGRARRSAKRMQDIIVTSLDLEKLKRGTLQVESVEADILAILRDSIATLIDLAAGKQVRTTLLIEGRPADLADHFTLRTDPVHLQRCTDNLIKNAIEASPAGTTVDVEVTSSSERTTIRVHNDGPPIPPDVRATLFHPFSTFGKRGGTGLGIYGVKLAVEAMGGNIDYETGEGGTAFRIGLPRILIDPDVAPTS